MRRPWAIALCVTLPLACAYLAWQPPAGDLAAATYRSDLFARVGFSAWDTGWYAAHGYWLPSYSLLSPALGALLGVRLLLALSALAASVLFALIAERVFAAGGGPGGTGSAPVPEAGGVSEGGSGRAHEFAAGGAGLAAFVFAVGAGVGMLSGRVPFDLGLAIGLGALLALLGGALPLALALAVLTAAASPVAGAFLALAALAGAGGLYSKSGGPRARARLLNKVSDVHRPRARAASPNGHDHPSRPAPGRDRPSEPATGHNLPSRPANPHPAQAGVPQRIDPRSCLELALAALAPILVLSLAYPNGGYEPFAAGAFWPALAGVALIALLLPRGSLSERGLRTVRAGAGLYALALVAAYALHTPMGGNAARLGALLAAPLLAGVLWPGHRRALLLLALPLLYWQLATPIRDYAALAGDPSTSASYYAPVLSELRRLQGGEVQMGEAVRGGRPRRFSEGRPKQVAHAAAQAKGAIVEVPLTKAHWEAAYLAGHDGIRLARGWERQLDTRYAALFYRPSLSPAAYRAWLRENRVAYVALPDAPLDGAGRLEASLVARGLPYLRELWRSEHWRLYRFMG